MPYTKTSELPPAVQKKFQGAKLTQYMAVWNEVYKRKLSEGLEAGKEAEQAKKDAEKAAFSTAWGVAQKAADSGELTVQTDHPTEVPQDEDEAKFSVNYRGIPIVIENPVGSMRSWDGEETIPHSPWYLANWSYGYIPNTVSNEPGEALDVYLGPFENNDVYLAILSNPDGSLDEMKVMVGFAGYEDAKKVLDAVYLGLPDRPKPELVVMSIPDFLESISYQAPAAARTSSNTANVTKGYPELRDRREETARVEPMAISAEAGELAQLRKEAVELEANPNPSKLTFELTGPVYGKEAFTERIAQAIEEIPGTVEETEEPEREVAEVPLPLVKAVGAQGVEGNKCTGAVGVPAQITASPVGGSKFELIEHVTVNPLNETMMKMIGGMQERIDKMAEQMASRGRYVRKIERDKNGLVSKIVEEPEE